MCLLRTHRTFLFLFAFSPLLCSFPNLISHMHQGEIHGVRPASKVGGQQYIYIESVEDGHTFCNMQIESSPSSYIHVLL